ncbi:MAG: c-type cytochrome, partial [Flavobacteriales bacterium]|nr:c-type cytochrome [Flavobacteriales bacterium]
GTFPQLAGQHRGVMIKQLADIRAKNRDNPTMYPFALPESIGDAQALADVVAYIEKLPMNLEAGRGPWGPDTPEYAKGEQLYKDNCVKCHGETGMGDGSVITKGGHPPPTAYSGPLKDLPEGKMFHTLTYGKGAMGSHASQLNKEERWLVIQYVKYLQAGGKMPSAAATAPETTN